jgi:uridine phosphorylase
MPPISKPDLILNPDGSVFHLGLRPEQVADLVLAVGDPARVPAISRHFSLIEHQVQKREFVTHTGMYKGRRITAISTGIGTDNVEIVLHELDALVNIDLGRREPKQERRSLSIIRVGTCGALQPDVTVGSIVVSDLAVGFDNLMNFYTAEPTKEESVLGASLQRHAGLTFTPYLSRGSASLRKKFGDLLLGNTVTCPGFYAPQGRQVRVPIRFPNILSDLATFRSGDLRLVNFEMETSAYFALGKLMGHETASVSVVLANRVTNEWAPDARGSVDKLIQAVLDRL